MQEDEEEDFDWESDTWPQPKLPPRSRVGRERPAGDALFGERLAVLNKHLLAQDPAKPGEGAVDRYFEEGDFGLVLSRRRSARLVTVFKGIDGLEYVQSELADFANSLEGGNKAVWGGNPLFHDNVDAIVLYAIKILKSWGLPSRFYLSEDGKILPAPEGFFWQDPDDCRLKWGPVPPPGIDPEHNAFHGFTEEIAGKFVADQFAKKPDCFEAVYASEYLMAYSDLYFEDKMMGHVSDLANQAAYGGDMMGFVAENRSLAFGENFRKGAEVGQRLGAIQHEWRLCFIHGFSVMKRLVIKENRKQQMLEIAEDKTKWHLPAFEYAEKIRRARPDIGQESLAEKILKDWGSGLKLPGEKQIVKQIRLWENKGFEFPDGTWRKLPPSTSKFRPRRVR